MNDIVINNSTNYGIDSICENIVLDVLKILEIDHASLSLSLVSDEEIHDINKTHRGIDKATDVITFSYEDVDNFNQLFEVRELGDIFIAVEYVFSNSKKYNHSMAREMTFVIVHGLLHTLGYTHDSAIEEKVMFDKQEEIIKKVIVKGSELDEIFN